MAQGLDQAHHLPRETEAAGLFQSKSSAGGGGGGCHVPCYDFYEEDILKHNQCFSLKYTDTPFLKLR